MKVRSLHILLIISTMILFVSCKKDSLLEETKIDSSIATENPTQNKAEDSNNQEFRKPILNILLDYQIITYDGYGQFDIKINEDETKTFQIQEGNLEGPNLSSFTITPNSTSSYLFDIQPDRVIQKVYKDEILLMEKELDSVQLDLPSDEGNYVIELLCNWDENENTSFYGNMHYSFQIVLDLPIEFEIVTSNIYPGDLFVVKAKNVDENQTLSIETELFEDIKFYPSNNDYVALIPTNCYSTPSNYTIKAIGYTEDYQIQTESIFEVSLLEKAFEEQHLIVSSSTSSIKSEENAAHDQEYFDQSKATPIEEKLWEGLFIQPIDGRISTEYGVIRYDNDNPVPRRHYGIDLANSTGTPIAASNSGVIKLAMELITTGNTVVIDHGMGLYTTYMHMDSIYVENGVTVSKGDIIGTVGTTGYSTGPHLHFSVWKDGAFLNPWTLFEKEIF